METHVLRLRICLIVYFPIFLTEFWKLQLNVIAFACIACLLLSLRELIHYKTIT